MYLLIIIIVFGIDAVNGDELYADLNPALFCPSNNTCSPPSSHILCTEHDPNLKHGANCKNFQDWAFTAAQVKHFLDWLNGIKARMASGTWKIKDGIAPKGYGVMRVQWDPELAALSRYLLQICDEDRVIAHNRCSWSGRFPQLVKTTVAFPEDVSETADGQLLFYETYFDSEILKHITLARVKSVNVDMHANGFTSLTIFQGPARHIGCSMARFTKASDNKKVNRRTYCMIAHFTGSKEPLYNITPPAKETGFTSECGCPLHFRESEGCLCEEWRPDTTSTYATYRTFKSLSGLPSDEIQWKRGIPDKSRSLDNRVITRNPEIFLPIINIEKDGPGYSNIWELLYNNLRNVVMPSDSKLEPLSRYTSQPNPMKTLNIDGMVNNAYNGPSTQAVTPLYYKDSYIDNIMDKYTKPSKQTMDSEYNKDTFTYNIMDTNINFNNQVVAPVSYREVLFDDVMKALEANSVKKDGIIKTAAEIIESLESKTVNSLEKIVSDYNKFVSRRSAILYDKENNLFEKKSEDDGNRAYDPPPADTSDILPVDTSDIPPLYTSDPSQTDTDFEDTILL